MRSITRTPSQSHIRTARKNRAHKRPKAVLLDRLIGDYRTTGVLGEGGTATVYAAEDKKGKVAIKLANTKNDNASLTNENEKLQAVDHPYVLKPIATGTFYGRTYLVTEHVEGENLSTVMDETTGVMPWERAKAILLDLCDALHELHKRGIAHRDVTPGNVLLSPDGLLKLIDFGLAAYFDKCTPKGTGLDRSVEGTPKYLAPEIIAGLKHDHRADIYAVGIIMYGLTTGKLPFVASEDSKTPHSDICNMQMKVQPKLPSKASPELLLSPMIDGIVMRAIDKDPTKRYQSMLELRNAIESIPLYAGGLTSYAHYQSARPVDVTMKAPAKKLAAVG